MSERGLGSTQTMKMEETEKSHRRRVDNKTETEKSQRRRVDNKTELSLTFRMKGVKRSLC